MFRSRCWWHHRIRFDELWEAWNPAAGVQVTAVTSPARPLHLLHPLCQLLPAVPALPARVCASLRGASVVSRWWSPPPPTFFPARTPPAHARPTQHLDTAAPLSDETARASAIPPRARAGSLLPRLCALLALAAVRAEPSRAELCVTGGVRACVLAAGLARRHGAGHLLRRCATPLPE
eukprot:COSAG01_NODE_4739_length_4782_cov_2.805467_7_plen_178_part_00